MGSASTSGRFLRGSRVQTSVDAVRVTFRAQQPRPPSTNLALSLRRGVKALHDMDQTPA